MPLAERKAAALSLDASLLAELLGKEGLKQLLDASVIASTEADLQGLSPERRAAGPEQLFDLLRTAGPFTQAERWPPAAPRDSTWKAAVEALIRRLGVWWRSGSPVSRCVAVSRGLYRGCVTDCGIPVPPGIAATFTEQAAHPIEGSGAALGSDALARSSPRRSPTATALGRAVVEAACAALAGAGTLVAGSFVVLPLPGWKSTGRRAAVSPRQQQYCHSQVLSLDQAPHPRVAAQSRAGRAAGVRTVPSGWQGRHREPWLRCRAGCDRAASGYALPASAFETIVLPLQSGGLRAGDARRADLQR